MFWCRTLGSELSPYGTKSKNEDMHIDQFQARFLLEFLKLSWGSRGQQRIGDELEAHEIVKMMLVGFLWLSVTK